jgi:hypothetical protein
VIDNGLTLTYYQDGDGDGYGDLYTPLESCLPPSGYIRAGGDCDDSDAAIGPQADEVCDGVDNDCDGAVDDGAGEQRWYADLDGDGYPGEEEWVEACIPPEGYQAAPDTWDCDDADATIGPQADEICDEIDNDCDDVVDEGVPSLWYRDTDGDGLGGNASVTGENCSPDKGYTLNSDDCDDSDPSVGAVSPYPLEGNALISEAADIDDICPCYSAINGALRVIALTDMTDLDGLSCLESTDGLQISDNESLTSLAGLDNLQEVDGPLRIEDNDQLRSLAGLSSLTAIGDVLTVTGNPSLLDLSDLSSLTTVNAAATLASNASMTHIGLSALEKTGKLIVEDCPSLTEINELTALEEARSGLSIQECSSLTTLDLPALTTVGGDVYIYKNASLASLSAPELSEVNGELRLHWVGDVTDLDGLSGLRKVSGDMFLWGNTNLSDVSGLHDMELLRGDLNISNNPNLTTEDAETLRDTIDTIRGSSTISNNGS